MNCDLSLGGLADHLSRTNIFHIQLPLWIAEICAAPRQFPARAWLVGRVNQGCTLSWKKPRPYSASRLLLLPLSEILSGMPDPTSGVEDLNHRTLGTRGRSWWRAPSRSVQLPL
jgi:hypothetical protein